MKEVGDKDYKGKERRTCRYQAEISGNGDGFKLCRELLEICRRRREEGVDTTQVERFIEEGLSARARGQAVYAEVLLQAAYENLC